MDFSIFNEDKGHIPRYLEQSYELPIYSKNGENGGKEKQILFAYDFKLLRLPTISILIQSSGSLDTSLFCSPLFSRKEQGVETQTVVESHS